MNMFKTERSMIGLDIGSYAVKMVELRATRGGYKLAGFGYRKLESASQGSLIDTVKELYTAMGTSSKGVNISLGPAVISRFIDMPHMSETDLKGALVFEVEKNIPFGAEEIVYDYQVVARDKDKKDQVLLAAAKKEAVERCSAIVKGCGLRLDIIDADCFALANAFLVNSQGAIEPESTYALVNIGSKFASLDILRGAALSFCRDIQMSGEEPKAVFNGLADEVRLSFEYFENRSGKGIDAIYLSGGVSELPEVKECFNEKLGIKASRLDPLRIVDLAESVIPADKQASFAVSLGLAMRS